MGSNAAAVPLNIGGHWADVGGCAQPGQDPHPLVISALSGITRYRLPEAVLADYLTCYRGDRFAGAARYIRNYLAELPALQELLPRVDTPVEIIAGLNDTAVPPANARFLHERLRHSQLDIIDDGHFTWEDAAADYATLVTSWWDAVRQRVSLTVPED